MTRKPDQWMYDLADERRLDGSLRFLFIELCRFADRKTNCCFPAVDTLAKRVKSHRRTVQSNLRKLEERGAIETHKQSKNNVQLTNKYQILGVAKKPPRGRR
ncbi:helix-turn-helix domain-containing protein [Gymnodinialimonas hymeniacidonis]|uniref:helix-turn-helix domain-containing protein n=1 Tax=Gymnodinialimonas hymeniacidonis TaxID=3126508 RepID=UPI0034C5CB7F